MKTDVQSIDLKKYDPRELIMESYRIGGITLGDCRTIFLDWAIGQSDGGEVDLRPQIEVLLTVYGAEAPDHPMTQVLRAGLADPPKAKRRGGRAARVAD